MKIITDISDLKLKNSAVTIGKFDGVHLGHQSLLRAMGSHEDASRVLFTFDRAPEEFFGDVNRKYITTEDEKREICRRLGVDIYISIPVTEDFLSMPPQDFLREILFKRLGAVKIVTGENFRFGRDRAGDNAMIAAFSKEAGCAAVEVKKERAGGDVISTSRIKKLIESGDVSAAERLLGHPYVMTGRTSRGKRIGASMGLPTANIYPPKKKLLPRFGVYKSVLVTEDGSSHPAITNVGVNPTVNGADERIVRAETHIPGFEGDLYGKKIEVRFLSFVRPEKKFRNTGELRAQIESDIKAAGLNVK